MRKYLSIRYRLFLVSLFLLITLTACHQKSVIQVQDTDKKMWSWNSEKYDYVIINYWASWCHQCRLEIPNLNSFYLSHHQDKILFLSVNMEDLSENELREVKKELKIKYPVLNENPNISLGVKDPEWIPAFYLFSPEGKRLKVIYTKQDLSSLNRIIQSLK